MRDQCALIVGLIPASCHQLTIHDITHLDALWDMADLIIDETFELSPAEAFVFGASVLIHDSGLTLAAYSTGLTEIKETVEWRDLAFSTLRKSGRTPSPELIREPPADCVNEITFLTLRSLHAKQAEKLIRATWRVPNSDRSGRPRPADQRRHPVPGPRRGPPEDQPLRRRRHPAPSRGSPRRPVRAHAVACQRRAGQRPVTATQRAEHAAIRGDRRTAGAGDRQPIDNARAYGGGDLEITITDANLPDEPLTHIQIGVRRTTARGCRSRNGR